MQRRFQLDQVIVIISSLRSNSSSFPATIRDIRKNPVWTTQIFCKDPRLARVVSAVISNQFRLIKFIGESNQIFREGTTPDRVACSREESNLHGFPHTVLSRTRLPFRHVSVASSGL